MIALLIALASAASPRWAPQRGVTESYNIAILVLGDGRPAEALELLAPILQEDPGCGQCQHTAAIARLRLGQSETALADLDVLSRIHDRPEVHTLRAVAAAAAGDHITARNTALRAVNQDPSAFSSQRALLRAMLSLGEHTEAQRVLQLAHRSLAEAEASCLGVEYALAVDNLPGARGAMSQCQRAVDPVLIEELSLRLAHAEEDLIDLVEIASRLGLTPLASKARAAQLLKDGAADAAQVVLDGVLADDPDDVDALLLRAQCHRATGALNDALLDLDRLQSLSGAARFSTDGTLRELHHPDRFRAQAGALRIMLLLDGGRLEEARTILDSHEINDVTAASSVRILLEEGHPTEAAAELERLVQQWPDAPQFLAVALQVTAEVPPSHALIGWVQSLRYRESVWQMARLQHHHGRHSTCTTLLGPMSDATTLPLAHRCAVAGGYLDEAQRRLTAMIAADILPAPDVNLRHAWLLGTSSDPDAGLALLADIVLAPEQVEIHRSLQVWLSVEAGQLQTALKWEKQGAIEPAHRAHLATALAQAHQPRRALRQMRQACAEMPEPDAGRCHHAVALLKEVP